MISEMNFSAKQTFLIILILFFSSHIKAQSKFNEQIIMLSDYQRITYLLRDDPDSLKVIDDNFDQRLLTSFEFVKESNKQNNVLLTNPFLALPDTFSLKINYICHRLRQNPGMKVVYENNALIDSLLSADILYYTLVDNYYYTLFSSVIEKNRPFTQPINIQLAKLELPDSICEAILHLKCMTFFGKFIRGYIYMVSPPKYQDALVEIGNFPTFENKQYYEFINFDFDDFQIEVYNDSGLRSYKKFYLGKLYDTLYGHFISLYETGQQNEAIYLWENSILSRSEYYEQTDLKEQLENIKIELSKQ